MENELKMLDEVELLGDRVLVFPSPKPKPSGALIIEDNTPVDVIEGIVVCYGEDTTDVDDLSKVLIPNHTGRKVTLKGINYIVLKEEVVIAIL